MNTYRSLNNILADLDAQQRRELAALRARIEPRELNRRRNAKNRLWTAAEFFIERSWEAIANHIRGFSLELHTGNSEAEIRAHLADLRIQGAAYAWGWLRARMDEWLMIQLEFCVPELLSAHFGHGRTVPKPIR